MVFICSREKLRLNHLLREEKGYTYDMVYRPLVSGVRDNSPPTDRFARIAREWNSHWAYPQMITSNPTRFFERFETQLRQIVNIAGLSVSDRPAYSATRTASLICAVCEGRMARYSRTGFRRRPTEDWAEEWAALSRLLVARDAPG